MEGRRAGPGRVEALWIKRFKRGPMDPVQVAALEAGRGIAGNADRRGRRQVTLLEAERWADAMAAGGAALDPAARRANVLVRGVDLRASRRQVLRVGAVRLRIWGETKPCERMDEACPGLKDVLWPDWGGGAYAEVLDDGVVRVGDPVRWDAAEATERPARAYLHRRSDPRSEDAMTTGTIRDYDPDDGRGRIESDEGNEILFDDDALEGGLAPSDVRPGLRVEVEVKGALAGTMAHRVRPAADAPERRPPGGA